MPLDQKVGPLIETGVPMPPPQKGAGWSFFATMNVGDSILAQRYASADAAYRYGKRSGKKFVARKTADGQRIWRVS